MTRLPIEIHMARIAAGVVTPQVIDQLSDELLDLEAEEAELISALQSFGLRVSKLMSLSDALSTLRDFDTLSSKYQAYVNRVSGLLPDTPGELQGEVGDLLRGARDRVKNLEKLKERAERSLISWEKKFTSSRLTDAGDRLAKELDVSFPRRKKRISRGNVTVKFLHDDPANVRGEVWVGLNWMDGNALRFYLGFNPVEDRLWGGFVPVLKGGAGSKVEVFNKVGGKWPIKMLVKAGHAYAQKNYPAVGSVAFGLDDFMDDLLSDLQVEDPNAAVTKDVTTIKSPGYPSWPEYFGRGNTKVFIQFRGQNHVLTITHGVVGMEDHRVERAKFTDGKTWSHRDRTFGDISFNEQEYRMMFNHIRQVLGV